MAGIDVPDPLDALGELILRIRDSAKNGQRLEPEELTQLAVDLMDLRHQLRSVDPQEHSGQTGVIASIGRQQTITVAGEGGVRYEVPANRIPAAEPGESLVAIAPDFRERPALYHRQFMGGVGAVGRVLRVLAQDGGPSRLQLGEGFVVEATERLINASPQPGDLVRFDPSRLLAFELIKSGGGRATGPIGLVTRVVEGPPTRLQITYGAGESFLVDPTQELVGQQVAAGDWVSFDPASRSAFGKVDVPQDASGSVAEVAEIHTTWGSNGQRTRRLHLHTGAGEGVLACLAPALETVEFAGGDLVRVDLRTLVIHEQLKVHGVSDLRSETLADTPYERIGGLAKVVPEIRKAMEWPYLFPEVFKTYELTGTKGILLYGPPGCGKTLIAKAIASNLRIEIARQLKKSAVQDHLRHLITGLQIHKSLLRAEQSLERVAKQWRQFLEQLPEAARQRLPEQCPPTTDPVNREDLSQQVKAFLLANDIGNLDTPDAEIEKLDAMLNADRNGNPKEPQAKVAFLSVSGPELLTKWVGETEHKIRKLFEKARRESGPYAPVIIFFDEIESMFQQRGSGISSDVEKTIVPQFLAELDGVRALRNVLIIGASNRMELIDPALLRPGRLDRKIRIDRPDIDAATEILLKYLKPGIPMAEEARTLAQRMVDTLYNEGSYIQITNRRGERFITPVHQFSSGAILESVVTRAKKCAAERWIAGLSARGSEAADGRPTGGEDLITAQDLRGALEQEFDENKDHFAVGLLAAQEPDTRRRPSIDDLTVTVHWAEEVTDRWKEPIPAVF